MVRKWICLWTVNKSGLKQTHNKQVYQWRTDACDRMASLDPRIKVHQIPGWNDHWPLLTVQNFVAIWQEVSEISTINNLCSTKKWTKVHQNFSGDAAHQKAEVKSKSRSWRCLQHLPNLTSCHSNVLVRLLNEYRDNHRHQYIYQICEVGQDMCRTFWDIWHDMPIFAVSPKKVLLLTA